MPLRGTQKLCRVIWHCAKRNDPGHDPQFRLTRRVGGKTVTESFPNPTALRKAQREVTEYHRFPTSVRTWWLSTKRSVSFARSSSNGAAGRSRKRKRRCDPSGGGARSKPIPQPCLCAAA